MDEQFLALPGPAAGSEQVSERLQAICSADRARERARERRTLLVALLGAVSVPLWLVDVWPGTVAGQLRSFVAAAWALTFASVLLAMALEAAARVRRSRQIARLGPLPVLRSAKRAAAAACVAPAEEQD